jgi:hypothetical protein
MSDQIDYLQQLKGALDAKRAWLDKNEMPMLKEQFRAFHTSLVGIYAFFVKKGYIVDDPYKQDVKTDDLKVPLNGPILEQTKRDQVGQRLSELSKEFDFLVNFYQFSLDNFTQDKIKIIMGLVRYINWGRLTPESDSPITQAISEIIGTARHTGGDPVSMTSLNEGLKKLEGVTSYVVNHLKVISDFNREQYKYDLRIDVIEGMSESDANLANIKKKFASACPGVPFYQELIEEAIREDFSQGKAALREAVLKKLAVAAEKTKTTSKAVVNYKEIAIDALNAIGASAVVFLEIIEKFRFNSELVSKKKHGIFDALKKLIAQMSNANTAEIIYELDYTDPNKNVRVTEKLNYTAFNGELDKKIKILQAIAPNGPASAKLLTMEDSQLIEICQRNIKDVLLMHKTLTGLDDYFKGNVEKADRNKVKGIKPELASLKNAVTRANVKLQEYSASVEEAAQFKKLGIEVAT